jgi:signal transduction histidine kinase
MACKRQWLAFAAGACFAPLEIGIRDNGVGIAPGPRDRLFQSFFTTKPTGEGTSISYVIVTQQHGGTITVGSEVDDFRRIRSGAALSSQTARRVRPRCE